MIIGKIGIIQNRISVSGRDVVISEVIKLCNNRGHIPTVFSFSENSGVELFKKEYGPEIQFLPHSFKIFPIARGGAYQTPLLNMLTAKKIGNFDIIFNSGRCPYFLPEGPNYIHYVHYPLEASLLLEEHFKSITGYLYTLPLKALYFKRAKTVKEGIFLANSQFTKQATLKTYPLLTDSDVKVLYPPCNISKECQRQVRNLDFVSLGSFFSDKRQLEQLELARNLPEYNFTLLGTIKSKTYFLKINHFIKQNKLGNVTLIPNASRKQVIKALSRSKIFLHNKRNEHFGISVVEAIDSGCIPIVHDSGGPREIVPFKELRFQNTNEAIEKSLNILSMGEEKTNRIVTELKGHIVQYSKDSFKLGLDNILSTIWGKTP